MILKVLFVQRKPYVGDELLVEALACATEYDYDANPDYLNGEADKADLSGEFVACRIIDIAISERSVTAQLVPPKKTIPGEVIISTPTKERE